MTRKCFDLSRSGHLTCYACSVRGVGRQCLHRVHQNRVSLRSDADNKRRVGRNYLLMRACETWWRDERKGPMLGVDAKGGGTNYDDEMIASLSNGF